MEQHKCRVLGMLLDKIVSDIFDSTTSDSSEEDSLNDESTFLSTDHEDNTSNPDDEPVLARLQQSSSSSYFKEVRKKKNSIDILISTCNHKQFKEYFKISRETFEFILKFIKYDLLWRGVRGSEPFAPEMQLLLTLRKMASLDSYSQVCRKFDVGRPVATGAVQRVILALSSRSSKFISWPSGNRLREVCQGFQTSSKIPKVIGAVDSALIFISNEHLRNHEADVVISQSQSAQLQVVVDHDGRLTLCSVGSFGKNEKQDVFNDSILGMFVSKSEERFPDGCYLVASPEYELHENVMVPYNGANLTAEQEAFNEHLKLAHSSVTKTISALKTRFPSLSSKLDIGQLELVPIYLKACCVLYNISLDRNDLLGGQPDIETEEFLRSQPEKLSVASARALEKRDLLCRQLHMSEEEGVCFV